MTNGTVVLLGDLSFEAPILNRLVQEFGWSFEVAPDLGSLRKLSAARNVVAILFDPNRLGLAWQEALAEVRHIDSQALLIPCHRFSEMVDWSDLADAGAFHALALPLDPREVRQSLAFVWSARFRRSKAILTMPAADARPIPTQLRVPA